MRRYGRDLCVESIYRSPGAASVRNDVSERLCRLAIKGKNSPWKLPLEYLDGGICPHFLPPTSRHCRDSREHLGLADCRGEKIIRIPATDPRIYLLGRLNFH